MEISSAQLEHLRVLGATHFSVALNLVSNCELRVYCDYPAGWQEKYFLEALYAQDPVFHAAGQLVDATCWDDIAAPFSRGNVVDQARDFGLENGVSIPVEIGDARHLVSLTLDGRAAPSRSHRDALTLASRTLVAELQSACDRDASRIQSIIAFFAAQGMGTQRIAELLRSHMEDRALQGIPGHPTSAMH